MTEYSRERNNRMQAILFAFAIVMANNTDVAFEATLKKPLFVPRAREDCQEGCL